jgi:2-oxoglutarate/2-oxoacid ferredoxin oxidoreductase subunit alpha
MRTDLTIGMAGAGGDGVIATGESLIVAAAVEGYHAVMTRSFGSQIRGGESSFRLRVSTHGLLGVGSSLDLAIALNWDDFLRFGAELPVDGQTTLVYDRAAGPPDRLMSAGTIPAELLAVPLEALARQGGPEKSRNAVVLGLIAGWSGLSWHTVLASFRRKLARRGGDLVERATRAFTAGLAYAAEHPLQVSRWLDPPPPGSGPKLVTDGNRMCGAAAIVAGCRFFGGYPITPSSEIMQFLDAELWKYGGTVLQAEDEIAGAGAAVGASFAGVKAMTATSGPGMSLKTEILGLASIAELPLVCVNVQRGGPSTGIPTKAEQADLYQAIFSAHGDVVRPVLAPISVADTFGTTVEAFNIAEAYQTPVVLLSDAEIAQRKETVEPIDVSRVPIVERTRPTSRELEHYDRFRLSESGISPISHPGLPGGNYLASGIEHNEHGAPTASGEMHARMNEKRLRKLQPLKARRDLFSTSGDPDAPLALISWGSTAGVALEALQLARHEGLRVKLLVPRLLYPVSESVYQEFLASVQAGLIIEQSHQGQLHRVLRMFIDLPAGIEPLARSGANPIAIEEIVNRLRRMTLALQSRHSLHAEPQFG